MSRKFKGQKEGFTKVDKVLHGIFKNLENPQKLQEAHIFDLWEKMVDPEIKRKAQPDRLYGKKLYIKTPEPLWAHELTLNYRQKILELLQKETGKENLTDIAFYAGHKMR